MTISASQRSCLIFSFTGTTTGNDIFKATSDAIDAMGLGWDKLCGVATNVKAEVKLLNSSVSSTNNRIFFLFERERQRSLRAQ